MKKGRPLKKAPDESPFGVSYHLEQGDKALEDRDKGAAIFWYRKAYARCIGHKRRDRIERKIKAVMA